MAQKVEKKSECMTMPGSSRRKAPIGPLFFQAQFTIFLEPPSQGGYSCTGCGFCQYLNRRESAETEAAELPIFDNFPYFLISNVLAIGNF
jgi:hypothetical protein